MYFSMKNTLKNNHNHTLKQTSKKYLLRKQKGLSQ